MSDLGESSIGEERVIKRVWRRFFDWFAYHHETKSKWLKDMKGSLSLAASIITTMTFQLATNPPGGVFQANGGDNIDTQIKSCLNRVEIACSGEAVLAVLYPTKYKRFIIANTVSFVASLSVCLLLVSGVPLNHRLPIWCLSIGMCITISSLALTYGYATDMVTPDPVWSDAVDMLNILVILWFSLLGFVALLLFLRFLVQHVPIWINKYSSSIKNCCACAT